MTDPDANLDACDGYVQDSADSGTQPSRSRRSLGRVAQVFAAAVLTTMAVLGSYEIIDGIRDLVATTVTCDGVVMSPGDSCSTLRLKRSRYESWSPAGTPPTLLPNVQHSRDRIMVRDIDAMRSLQHEDAGGQIAVGIWLLLPILVIVVGVGIARLVIAARQKC